MTLTAKQIRNIRRRRKLTTTQLAELCGVSRNTVVRWEMTTANKRIPGGPATVLLRQLATNGKKPQ